MAKPIAVVTGGAGFIGSHIVDELVEQDFEVRIIDNLFGGREENLIAHRDNPSVIFVEKDIRDLENTDSLFKGVRFVFHIAGVGDIVPSIENPSEYMSANVQGTVRVLEAARRHPLERFVYAASSSCYGLAKVPTDEHHPISPEYPYALSKYQGEQAVIHWSKVYRLPVNSIRIFNAYGMRQRTSGAYGAVFGVFLKQKLAGQPFTLVGDGTQTRDFLYVTDVAKAFVTVAKEAPVGEIYNLGASNPQSVNRLIELLGGEVTHIPKRPGEPDCTWADTTKLRRDTSWQPLVSFEEGVQHILDGIDYWRDAPLWDAQSIGAATKTWFELLGEPR